MKNLVRTLCADLRKIRRGNGWKQWLSALVINQSFKTIVLYRLTHACRCKPLHLIVGGAKRLYATIHGVYISDNVEIGAGFCISHCFSIIIAGAKIGKNCVVMQQVTIGSSRGGKRAGYPILGDNVVVCCGAKIIGNVRIGNNVIIGANAVVVTDIPDYAVVGGVPAKVIGKNGKAHVKQWVEDMK